MDCSQWAQWWGPHFSFFWIIPLIFMILMFVFVVFLFRHAGDWRGGGWHGHGWGPSGWHGPGAASQSWDKETPRQILDRRYASGEITKEQYAQMKQDIETGQGHG
jgi:putative membrane protein